jgi:hypothetical protein
MAPSTFSSVSHSLHPVRSSAGDFLWKEPHYRVVTRLRPNQSHVPFEQPETDPVQFSSLVQIRVRHSVGGLKNNEGAMVHLHSMVTQMPMPP